MYKQKNRISHYFEASIAYKPDAHECCGNCSQPLEGEGAWYYQRRRFCKTCYEDHLDWDDWHRQQEEAESFDYVQRLTGLGLVMAAVAGLAVVVMVFN